MLKEAWSYVNWLTHSQSGRWLDAEVATSVVSHALGLATSICIRQLRKVPEQCPECGSYHLFPEEGMNVDEPELIFERPVCADCGWSGEPVAVDERTEDEIAQFITREGEKKDECAIMTTPLIGIRRPGET